jgi:hypothetical protein
MKSKLQTAAFALAAAVAVLLIIRNHIPQP